MYELIYLLAAGTTAIVALVAIWAARSRVHWFWRAAALLTCFLLLVPVGAAELNLLFAPVAGLLFLASAGQQWWERRKERLGSGAIAEERGRESIRAEGSSTLTASGPNRLRTPLVRFSLKELFLVILLAAVAAWIVARIVQEGIVMDWRKLPIAVVTIATVAWIASVWVDKPRTWQPFWATAVAYLIGFAMVPASINVLIYRLHWESPLEITIAAACIVCLTMVVTYSWLTCVGRMPQTILLIAAIYAAAYIHANYLGDWLSADYLLIEQKPPVWWLQRIIYGVLYFHLAIFVLLGVPVVRGLALPTHQSWQNLILARLSIAGLGLALLPLAWLHWRLMEIPQFTSWSNTSAVNSLPDANKILLRIQQARKAAEQAAPATTVTGPWLPDTPEMQRLTQEFFAALEKPGSVSRRWDAPEEEAAIQSQLGETRRLLDIAIEVLALGYGNPASSDHEEKGGYALAQVRYANYVQRGALALDAWMAYRNEEEGHLQLAMNHDQLSQECRRGLLRALRELDRTREPLDMLLAREAGWTERHGRWRSRLHRVVLGKETWSIDLSYPHPTVRQWHNECLAIARLNMTNMAIRLFQEDEARLPSNLQELVPRYLDAVPTDPYSGESIAYRLAEGSCALYSVGPDGKDDGGRVMAINGPYWSRFQDGDFDWETIVRQMRAQVARAKAAAKAPVPVKVKAAPAAQGGQKS